MRRSLSVLAAAAVLVVAGCGGSSSGGGGGSDSDAPASGKPAKEIFANACGSCHTLGAAGTKGNFGPNLDDLQPTQAEVADAIANGPGPMPSGLVKGADADAVAKYVADSAGS